MIYRKHIQREYLAAVGGEEIMETVMDRRIDLIVSAILGTLTILAFAMAVLIKIGAI